MSSVDFLPSDYRRQAADRRSHIWLFIALVVYGGFVGVVATHQFLARQALLRRYKQWQLPYAQAQLANQRFAELQSQLAEANDLAALHTYLRHPWPRTQVLAALIEHLPPEVTLTEVTIRREKPDGGDEQRNVVPSPTTQSDAETPRKSSSRQSLDQLRKEIDATHTVVWVRGVTTDNSALHRCIRALGDTWLFTKADLESLDSMEDDVAPGAASFEICLELRPGYGQPGGPAEAPSKRVAS